MLPRKQTKQEDNQDAWLITYADMITLLLCFFTIFLAISTPKQSKLEAAKTEMVKEFSRKAVRNPLEQIREEFRSILFLNHLHDVMQIEETDKGINLEFKSSSFYDSGSAEVKDSAKTILQQVVTTLEALKYEDYKITVEGHTDDTPIHTSRYPSNWELSASRATNVIRFFIEQGVTPDRLKAAGYADIFPKVPNRDLSGKPIPANQAINRRIVIKIEKE